jgi:hypothetical protein
MKKRWKILVALVVVATISTVFYFWYAHRSLRNIKGEAGLAVTANELREAFRQNEAEANRQYNNKAVVVTGKVCQLFETDDVNTLIIGDSCKVNCVFDKANWQRFKEGQNVTLKGICSDYIGGTVSIRECIQQ